MTPDALRPKRRRPDMRRAVVLLPNGLTLGNLFFGIYAIISASRGNFDFAVLCIVLGGACDALDGRVARATGGGSPMGEELDSLVDAISFGLAPAMITYFAVLRHEGASWLLVFLFAMCAVLRLARFNIMQAGRAKSYFVGLPSPAAGGTLATYYWFAQTGFYERFDSLPWREMMMVLMGVLAALMVSNVRYPTWPRIGFRSIQGVAGLLAILSIVGGVVVFGKGFFFPFGVVYVTWGLANTVIAGMLERRPGRADVATYLEQARAHGVLDDELDDVGTDEMPVRGFADPDAVRARRRRVREERMERSERGERGRRERGARTDRGERLEKSERPERGERSARAERTERGDRNERGERSERGDRDERTERGERRPRGERADRPERAERGERTARAERGDRPPRDRTAPDSLVAPAEAFAAPGTEEAALAEAGAPAENVTPEGDRPPRDRTRKRKRRRGSRSGERGERGDGEPGGDEGEGSVAEHPHGDDRPTPDVRGPREPRAERPPRQDREPRGDGEPRGDREPRTPRPERSASERIPSGIDAAPPPPPPVFVPPPLPRAPGDSES